MTKLPVVSAQEAVRVIEKLGYLVDHQTGSHIISSPSRPTASPPDGSQSP